MLPESSTPTKTCLRCSRTLDVAAFSRHKGRADGLQAYCKACYRQANLRTAAANMARSIIEAPSEKPCSRCGKVQPASEFYVDRRRRDGLYANCRACHRVLTDDWKGDHPEVVKRIARGSYGRCAGTRRRESREFRMAHLDYYRAYGREYKRTHRVEATALQRNRDARKLGNGGTHTGADIQAQYKRQHGRCYYCGEKLSAYHVDHVVPLALGGSNGPENLVVACPRCNCSKSGKHPMDFAGRLL